MAVENGGLHAIFRNLNQPLVKGAFLRYVVGTVTNIVGLSTLFLYHPFDLIIFNAIGTLIAALLMLVGSLVLMAQARALITGHSLPTKDIELLRDAILADKNVEAVNHLAAICSGASEGLLDTDLDLAEELDMSEIEAIPEALEFRGRAVLPGIERVGVLLDPPRIKHGDQFEKNHILTPGTYCW